MKKQALAALLLLFTTCYAYSQTVITNVKFNKVDRPALMLELPYDQEVSEQFIIDNLKKSGYELQSSGSLFWKKNKVDGFYVFKGVNLKSSDRTVDLYFKVEPKSRRQKNVSIVYLLMDKGAEDFVTSGDGAVHAAGQGFMNEMVPQSAVYKLNLDIKAQEEAVQTAQKKLDRLMEDEKKLNKRLEDLQNDIKKNKQDQESQQRALENEKARLVELRAKA